MTKKSKEAQEENQVVVLDPIPDIMDSEKDLEKLAEIIDSSKFQKQLIEGTPPPITEKMDVSRKQLISEENRVRVRLYKIAGIPHKEIAESIGIPLRTLERVYNKDLNCATNDLNALAVGKVISKINSGSDSVLMFYLRTRGRWAPTDSKNEIKDEPPLLRSREEIEADLIKFGLDPKKVKELND